MTRFNGAEMARNDACAIGFSQSKNKGMAHKMNGAFNGAKHPAKRLAQDPLTLGPLCCSIATADASAMSNPQASEANF